MPSVSNAIYLKGDARGRLLLAVSGASSMLWKGSPISLPLVSPPTAEQDQQNAAEDFPCREICLGNDGGVSLQNTAAPNKRFAGMVHLLRRRTLRTGALDALFNTRIVRLSTGEAGPSVVSHLFPEPLQGRQQLPYRWPQRHLPACPQPSTSSC